jgi:phosphonate transport system substrate-binding protein
MHSLISYLAGMIVLVLSTQTLGQTSADGDKPDPLVFGFLPIVSSELLVRRFSPLTDYLSEKLGAEIRMETAPDFKSFVQRTNEGQRYDILFTAPHLYYLASKNSGYRAIVRVDRPGMKAVIVTPVKSTISSIQDLRGHRLATTDPLALATVLARARLAQADIDPDNDLTLIATPSHNASLLSCYRGTTDAAVLIRPLYLRARPEIRDNTRIVAETGSVPHMPVAVAPWVDKDIARRLTNVLVNMSGNPQGRALLQHLDWPGFVAVQPGDYDGLGLIADKLGVE